jgi:hypothetical protein
MVALTDAWKIKKYEMDGGVGVNTKHELSKIEEALIGEIFLLQELVPKWISVDDELPEIEFPVLALINTQEKWLDHMVVYYCGLLENGKPCWEICPLTDHPYFDDQERHYSDPRINSCDVHYWMPMLKAPEELLKRKGVDV